MRKEKLNMALHVPIKLVLNGNDEIYTGYLAKDLYNPRRYCILPLDVSQSVIVFPASYVKQYTYLNNNVTIK